MKFDVLARCSSEAGISAATDALVQSLGFDLWAYSARMLHGNAWSGEWSLHNFPRALWSAYSREHDDGSTDPITDRSKRHIVPMVWLIDQMPTTSVDAGGPVDQVHAAARQAGVTGGLCLPVHDVAGVVATLTLATTQRVTAEALESACTHALLFSKHLHEACRPFVLGAAKGSQGQARIAGAPAEPKGSARSGLSPREVECLTWASKGKTAWEIGRVLGISEHTAIFHLRNASTKLGTANRQQAVAKSIQLGLVEA